jgi:hypothetical protein
MVLTFTLKSIYSGTTYVAGPFDISGTTSGGTTTLLGDNISKSSLLAGVTFSNVDDATTGGTIQSVDGICSNSIQWSLTPPPTPTPTPEPEPVCKQLTVVQTFTSTTIQYTTCSGDPGSTPLANGVTNYSIGCVQEGSASGAAEFSYGDLCD